MCVESILISIPPASSIQANKRQLELDIDLTLVIAPSAPLKVMP